MRTVWVPRSRRFTLGKAVRFINLSDVVLEKNLDAVLEEIIKQVTAIGPDMVVVDSFRTVVRKSRRSAQRRLKPLSTLQH
jgi:predicted ATP-dependent serine protease